MIAWTDARSVQLFSDFPRFDLFGFFPAGDYSKLINVLVSIFILSVLISPKHRNYKNGLTYYYKY